MKFSHYLPHCGVLILGLALGSTGTFFFKSSSEPTLAQSTGQLSSAYPANNDTSQALESNNVVAALSSSTINEGTSYNERQAVSGSADLSDYRHLIPVLLEIADADSQTLYSIAEQRLLNAPSLTPENRVITTVLFQRWAQVDTATALNWLENELLPVLANSANHPQLDDAVSTLSRLQPEQTAQWMGQLSNEQANAVRALVLGELTNTNADIDQTISIANESERPWLSAQYAGKLAQTDPLKAYQWTTALVDETSRDAALSELLWRWAETDVEGLSDHIVNESDPELQRQMYNKVGDQLIEHIGKHDPQTAMMWVDEQNTDAQFELRKIAYKRWIEEQPELALDWLRNQAESIEAQSLNALALPHALEQDLDLALSMFNVIDSTTQSAVTTRMVYKLSSQRPHEVETWVASISNPNAQSIARAAISDLNLLSQSEELIAQLDYKTGSERTEHLHTIMRVLSTGNPDRFSEWLHSDSLSEEDHQVLSSRGSMGKCG